MIKKFLFALFIFSLVSYKLVPKSKQYPKDNLVVDLIHKEFDDDFYLDSDFYYTSIKIGSLNNRPKYSQYIKENYKGIPKNDSVLYGACISDRFLFKEFYNHNDLNKQEEEWYLSNKDIDTLNLSKVKLKSTLIIVIGFYKDKQFIIADVNRNKDFSDDVKYEYDINFRDKPYENIDFLNKQPISEYSYESYYKGTVQKYNRRFILYPDRDNRFSISDGKKGREYFSILKMRDYWKGETTIDNTKIDFIYHGYRNNYGVLIVKPSSVKYENSYSFESQYSHKYYADSKIDDTITINDRKYMIDSINRDISKLYLRAVGKRKHFGYEVGNYVSNIELKDLQNNSFKINNIIPQKKYTLIEFWGTWCGPCVAMTPKLKELQKEYSQDLNMVSIAVDDDKKKVENYVKKHNLNWKILQIPKVKSWDNPIIKSLNIKFYPTFILIDANGKIISRNDSTTFDDLVKKII